jgi:hypothetical protein
MIVEKTTGLETLIGHLLDIDDAIITPTRNRRELRRSEL